MTENMAGQLFGVCDASQNSYIYTEIKLHM